MRISVPKEIKKHEYRVSMTPDAVAECVAFDHEVWVETLAGEGVGFDDADYIEAGAKIAGSASETFDKGELIVKVKEPQLHECAMLRPDQTLFTYLHLAADKPQAEALCKSGCIAIAYETVTDRFGRLPLLSPMSEVAGRMSVQVGAAALERHNGGRGLLLGGVPGVLPAKVVILGGGVSGTHAAQMAIGMRADVTLFDISDKRLDELDQIYGGRLKTAYSTRSAVAKAVMEADLIIGAVLIPGAVAPKLVTADMVKTMQPGAVLVDIAIDQGGCFETSRPTTHDEPTFIVDGIVHYCVANMPGAVARTSAMALGKATLPFIWRLAKGGIKDTLRDDPHLAAGLNVADGYIAYEPVARDLDMEFRTPDWL
ncbi:alanine dehydrogenase [Robiginitomaculum antarcticum]|uniref:alanine dehydrogenase n=1 Tax=Robiginitomaculum antarcticum TaxID=437507 RepID=UPI00037652E3|nr:alanine dehydrogenase [Robiginitomaculum antarcticum]